MSDLDLLRAKKKAEECANELSDFWLGTDYEDPISLEPMSRDETEECAKKFLEILNKRMGNY